MTKQLLINGEQNFMGVTIPVIEGGFGENQKVMLAKTISEIHGQRMDKINSLINDNIEEFEIGVDLLDLKNNENFANLCKVNGLKYCKHCNQIKPFNEFYKGENKCKICKKELNKVECQCVICGVVFKSRNKNAKYCSDECSTNGRTNRVIVRCTYCNKEKSVIKSEYKRKEKHFCDNTCYYEWIKLNPKFGENNPNYNSIIANCECCGKEITVKKSHYDKVKTVFCGLKCKGKYMSENFIGENNHNWNPNLTNEEREKQRNYPEYIEFIKKVLARDSYTCQCCGSVGNGKNLNVHHLDGYNWCVDKRTDIDNGVTLCESCHKDFHSRYGYGDNTKEQFEEYTPKGQLFIIEKLRKEMVSK